MLKLRTILLYDKLYYFIAILITIYALFSSFYIKEESNYNNDDTKIKGYITSIKIDGSKITLYLEAKENIIATYYAKTEVELLYIKSNYKLGDYLLLEGNMTDIKDNSVINLFSYKDYLYHQGIFYIFETVSFKKIKDNNKLTYYLKQKIIDKIESLRYSSDSVKAFAIGDSYQIDKSTMRTYQSNGISHLLALSGSNIALLALALSLLFKKTKANELSVFIFINIFLFFYMFVASFTASIVRATIFFTLLSINKVYYFNIKAINILLLTYSLLLSYNCNYIFDIGFQFSFIISYFLLLSQEYIENSKNILIKTIKVSFISFLGSMPIVIYNFYQINLLSIIYNLFYVPFVSFLIYPLSLLVIVFPIFDLPINFLVKIMESSSIFLDKIDTFKFILAKPSLFILFIYYIIILYIVLGLKNNTYLRIIILLLVLVIHNNISYINNYTKLTMLDVGQGDSFLINFKNNEGNILIDTGGKMPYKRENFEIRQRTYSTAINVIIPYLKSIGIKKLNYLILTHGDYDHMGEAINLVDNFKVNNIIMNDYSLTDIEKDMVDKYNVVFMKEKDIINLHNNKLYILNPENNSNENDNSLVIYIKINNKKILFMGDASVKVEERLLIKYNLSNIDILKIGHHGSYNSTSEKFVKKLSPSYALISVGEKNNFGHPNKIIIDRLAKYNVKTYLTSKNGSTTFEFINDKISVSTCN